MSALVLYCGRCHAPQTFPPGDPLHDSICLACHFHPIWYTARKRIPGTPPLVWTPDDVKFLASLHIQATG